MSSISIAARSGRFRFRFAWWVLLAAAMAALHLVRTRADTKADEAARSRRRGLDYEDHVLEPQRLPYSSRRRGGHIGLLGHGDDGHCLCAGGCAEQRDSGARERGSMRSLPRHDQRCYCGESEGVKRASAAGAIGPRRC